MLGVVLKLYWGNIKVILGLYWGNIRVILGLWGYIGPLPHLDSRFRVLWEVFTGTVGTHHFPRKIKTLAIEEIQGQKS